MDRFGGSQNRQGSPVCHVTCVEIVNALVGGSEGLSRCASQLSLSSSSINSPLTNEYISFLTSGGTLPRLPSGVGASISVAVGIARKVWQLEMRDVNPSTQRKSGGMVSLRDSAKITSLNCEEDSQVPYLPFPETKFFYTSQCCARAPESEKRVC